MFVYLFLYLRIGTCSQWTTLVASLAVMIVIYLLPKSSDFAARTVIKSSRSNNVEVTSKRKEISTLQTDDAMGKTLGLGWVGGTCRF